MSPSLIQSFFAFPDFLNFHSLRAVLKPVDFPPLRSKNIYFWSLLFFLLLSSASQPSLTLSTGSFCLPAHARILMPTLSTGDSSRSSLLPLFSFFSFPSGPVMNVSLTLPSLDSRSSCAGHPPRRNWGLPFLFFSSHVTISLFSFLFHNVLSPSTGWLLSHDPFSSEFSSSSLGNASVSFLLHNDPFPLLFFRVLTAGPFAFFTYSSSCGLSSLSSSICGPYFSRIKGRIKFGPRKELRNFFLLLFAS